MWNSRYREWEVARFHKAQDWHDTAYFVNRELEDNKLTGWLPMPKTDDEGNVK